MEDHKWCNDCDFHNIYFDNQGWDGCWCNNEKAKEVNQHITSCTYSVGIGEAMKDCRFWKKEVIK